MSIKRKYLSFISDIYTKNKVNNIQNMSNTMNLLEHGEDNTMNLLERGEDNTMNLLERGEDNTMNLSEHGEDNTMNFLEYGEDNTMNLLEYGEDKELFSVVYAKENITNKDLCSSILSDSNSDISDDIFINLENRKNLLEYNEHEEIFDKVPVIQNKSSNLISSPIELFSELLTKYNNINSSKSAFSNVSSNVSSKPDIIYISSENDNFNKNIMNILKCNFDKEQFSEVQTKENITSNIDYIIEQPSIYKLKRPLNFPINIDKHTINNLIRFAWCSYMPYKSGFRKCDHTYDDDILYYSFHPNIKIIKYLKKHILEDFLTLDSHMDFDYGLLKKSILIATLDNNFSILDQLLSLKININKIYFDNMTLLEYATHLFKNNHNFEVIEMFILYGSHINKPFKDGSSFFQNFITALTRITISNVTAIDSIAFQLYKDNKMDEFYDIYFQYGIDNINMSEYSKYIAFLLNNKMEIKFMNIPYLLPENKYNIFIKKYTDVMCNKKTIFI
jgi:hypothetical protein